MNFRVASAVDRALLISRKLSLSTLARLRSISSRYRGAILGLAFAVFAGGIFLSLRDLELEFADLNLLPLSILALVLVPCTIAYSAVNMIVMAHAAKVPMRFVDGVRVSAFAQVAELLPIPGGMIVRTAALAKAGASLARSGGIVIAFSLLWIACATIGVGLAMTQLGWIAGAATGSGLILAILVAWWIAKQFDFRIAVLAIGLRIIGLAIQALRLFLAFAVVQIPIGLPDSLAFAFAAILGSAAAIVPAGLGVSESLAALLANPLVIPPAAAFLAMAISRIVGFAANMLLVMSFLLIARH